MFQDDPEDVPGLGLGLNVAVSSVVDEDTKPSELYRLDFTAGQVVLLTVDAPSGMGSLRLYNPTLATLDSVGSEDLAAGWSISSSISREFVPAVSGTYYAKITADGSGQRYTFQASVTGAVPTSGAPDDLPGQALTLGVPVESVVDEDTRPIEVYSIDLEAGDVVLMTVDAPNGLSALRLYNPTLATLDSVGSDDLVAGWSISSSFSREFVPAVSGRYDVRISADGPGQPYELELRTTGSVPTSGAPDEVPGQALALGTPVNSVVDEDTRPVEVYAVELEAGTTVLLSVDAPQGLSSMRLYNPSTTSLESASSSDIAESWSVSSSLAREFVPAISGTYLVRILADGPGQTYELEVRTLG